MHVFGSTVNLRPHILFFSPSSNKWMKLTANWQENRIIYDPGLRTRDFVIVLQTIEIQCVTFFLFFQLCLYLTVWLAEDCHFGPNAPQTSWASHDQNFSKFAYWGGVYKMTKFAKKVLLQMPHLGVSHDKNVHIWGVKNALIIKKNVCSKCPQKSFGGLSLPKFAYIGGQNAHVGVKIPTFAKHFFCFKYPPKSIGGLL